IEEIANLKLDEMVERLAKLDFNITYTKAVSKLISKKAYDKSFGARPIDRYIKKNIEDDLAEAILAGKLNKDDNIEISVRADKPNFKIKNDNDDNKALVK